MHTYTYINQYMHIFILLNRLYLYFICAIPISYLISNIKIGTDLCAQTDK